MLGLRANDVAASLQKCDVVLTKNVTGSTVGLLLGTFFPSADSPTDVVGRHVAPPAHYLSEEMVSRRERIFIFFPS